MVSELILSQKFKKDNIAHDLDFIGHLELSVYSMYMLYIHDERVPGLFIRPTF